MCKSGLSVGVVIILLQIQFASGDLSIDQKIREGNRNRELDVRLVDGISMLEGRVEIRYNGKWGTICDDGFTSKTAKVVCHMLGYQRLGATPYKRAAYGEGKGPIWLDDLKCRGNETSLGDCKHLPWGFHNCGHKEDAGVKCQARKKDERNRMLTLELDMVVKEGERPKVFQRNKGNRNNAVKDQSKLWMKDIVYMLEDGIDSDTEVLIRNALDEWARYSCLHFSQDVLDNHYNKIVFTVNQGHKGCASTYVGMKQGPQEIHLTNDCLHRDIILHEIGHALGFYHEHNRADRDRYIRVHYENITQGYEHQFIKLHKDEYEDFGKPYDYKSIMHYGRLFFSRNESQNLITMETLDPEFHDVIGKVKHPSFLDYKILNAMYECSAGCSVVQCPVGGFLGQYCQCYCEGNQDNEPITLCSKEKNCQKPSINNFLFDVLDRINETVVNMTRDSYPDNTVFNIFSTNLNCNIVSELLCENGKWKGQMPDCPVELGIKLIAGSDDEGIIELMLNEQWRGFVCDDNWDDNDATVACRMMGFEFGKARVANSSKVIESLQILLDDVKCSGSESTLSECNHNGWGKHNCEHSEVAAIKCFPYIDTQRIDVLSNNDCGKIPVKGSKRRKREVRIVGGAEVVKGMYPWQVGIQRMRGRWIHWCGGTILSSQWIMSAAHCFDDLTIKHDGRNVKMNYEDFRVFIGDHDWTKDDEHEQEFHIEYLVKHWQYSEAGRINPENDIALLKIDSDSGAVFNDYVQPACLPGENVSIDYRMKCEVSGWGKRTESGEIENKLRSVEVPILEDRECENFYKHYPIDTQRVFCAGDVNVMADTCKGDSGGPLVCDIKDRNTVIGITSWGLGCGRPNAPGVYTKVSSFVSWIKQQILLHDFVVDDYCDPRGSLSTLSNPFTSRCDCRENVYGERCDTCKANTFYLSNSYELGCVRCFCTGVSTLCQSTTWNRAQVGLSFSSNESGVRITDMNGNALQDQRLTTGNKNRELVYQTRDLSENTLYWSLPTSFLGDMITAYGGSLKFTIRYSSRQGKAVNEALPLVKISGNYITLIHRSRQEFEPNKPQSVSIMMYEQNWYTSYGHAATREHLLMALADLDSILIRATFENPQVETGLRDVTLDIAESSQTRQDQAYAVESCQCPVGYRGLSCEDCDTGYTRSGDGPYLGFCEPCRCNGHSNECDPDTGVCRECQHDTEGYRCERCAPGFYGDATSGTATDCRACPCPLTSPNQFSRTCYLAEYNQDKCNRCPTGYSGRQCEIPSQAPGANVYSFDGNGYAVTYKNKIQSPFLAHISLYFKTFWVNASLLFVGNEETMEYMSLELRNGKVVFNYYLGEGTYGALETDSRYNTKHWVSVVVARIGEFAMLQVGAENKQINASAGDYFLDGVENSNLFYGGMPPSVNMNKYKEASGKPIVTDRFLGCMRGLQISIDSVNLWDGKATVGVTEGCKNSGLRSIGFYGSGFAEYPGVSLASDEGGLSVSFTTEEPDALLLLAKGISGDQFYYLTLTDGHVEGRFSGGGKPVVLKSDKTYSDGRLHNIAVKKNSRRIELYVDDKSIGKRWLENRFDTITVREDGGLYLGGLPGDFETNVWNKAAVSKTLDGCLSDVVINGNMLNINDPKQYHMADIGRCRKRDKSVEGFNTNLPPVVSDSLAPAENRLPEEAIEISPVKTTEPPKPKMTEKLVSDEAPTVPTTRGPTSCAANTGIFDYEMEGFAFGDEEISLIQINVTKEEIQRKPSQAPGAIVYSFDGTGYAMTDKNIFEDPRFANIILDIKTYWDNASLIFVGNEETGEYMSLELRNGKIVFNFYLGEGTYGTLETDFRYNTKNWVSVAAARSGVRALLQVGAEIKKMEAPAGDALLDGVENSNLFYGGMPPSVNMNKYKEASGKPIVTDRFLGCMRGLQIFLDSVNLWDGKATVGVTEGCKNSGLRSIGFNGSGYAEYPGVSLDSDEGHLSLSFTTEEPDALLLLAKSINGDQFYHIALTDGHVEARFSGGGKPVVVKSDKTYNDGRLHNVAVKKTSRRIKLYVDDKSIGKGRLENRFDTITVREDGGLYLGGLPGNFETDVRNKAAISKTLDGCLSDVVINGNVLNINDPKQYHMADIGKCRKRDKSAEGGFNTNLLPVVSDSPAAAEIRFLISLEFRSFYQDGLLLYLSNMDHTTFFATQLKDGAIVVSYDRKGSIKEMVVDTKDSLGDGKWHTVVLNKSKQRIIVTVDNKRKKGGKISKVLTVDVPLFVGGVPKTFVPMMNDKVVQHSIRGCIRNLLIDNNVKTFEDATLVSGVDKCFTKVERGAHFTGDSYGVYANKFEVGGQFTVELEFRTSKPEGILATVSNPDGGEALALQLHQGQVKLNVINNGGQVMTSTSFNSVFSLCDNEWHKIRASLKKNNVIVEVDEKMSFSDSGRDGLVVTATSAPLYLGGKPEFSNQAAALTSLGFEGCLRNVLVQDKPVDWFKLSNSVAIHKTSCPVS